MAITADITAQTTKSENICNWTTLNNTNKLGVYRAYTSEHTTADWQAPILLIILVRNGRLQMFTLYYLGSIKVYAC